MNVGEIKQFLLFQNRALDSLEFLIKYDREQALKNNEPAEKTIILKAFIDTQRKSLDVANRLLQKHENALKQEEQAKAEKEKPLIKPTLEKSTISKSANVTPVQQPNNDTEPNLFDTLQDGENE